MIARTWKGITSASRSDEYLDYLRQTGVRSCKATPGNRGVFVLRRLDGDHAEFLFISLWESIDAIKRFAGDDVDRAVYYPKDREFLLELEPTVTHFEVAVAPPSSGQAASRPEAAMLSRVRGI
jgi:heme-degrading monooxygenase HmoA